MKSQGLTVAGLQIYFGDSGAALFDAEGKRRSAVEMELTEYREFIDLWLKVSEESARPRGLRPEEQQWRAWLKQIVRIFRTQFGREWIDTVMRQAANQPRYSALSLEDIEESIEEVMSTL